MFIFDYIKKFRKPFSGRQVQEELDVLRDELTGSTIVAVEALYKRFADDGKLNSVYYRTDRDGLINDLARRGTLRQSNPIKMIHQAYQNVESILNVIGDQVKDKIPENSTADGLSLTTATALQLLDLIGFASRYTRLWIDVILIAESNKINQIDEAATVTPAVIKFLGENRLAFAQVISLMATPVKQLESALESLPEVVIGEVNQKMFQAIQGGSKSDPLRLGFIQSQWNPIYILNMMATDWQVHRYKMAKEELTLIETRIARLERQMAGRSDPSQAEVVRRYSEQVERIRGKLYKMEKDIADDANRS